MRIQKEIENVERVKDKIATMPLTMEDAIEFHKQVVDRVEKERKEINKELDLDTDIEEKGFTGASKEPKKVSSSELKKMKLSESLFKSLNEELEDTDGWGDEIEYTLDGIFSELENLMYEVRNCRRGSYTDCETADELAAYVHRLADDLDECSQEINANRNSINESLNEGYFITDFNKLKRILKKIADDPNSIVIDPDYTTTDVINGKNCYCIYANGIEDDIIDYTTQKLEDDFYTDVEVFDVITNSNNIDFNKLPKAAKEDLEKYGEEELNNSYYICIALKNSVDESLNECDKFKKGDCKNYALDEAKISRQNQRRKKDANLQRKEAERKRAEEERKRAEEEARKKERIGDAAWGEKDWIAEREKGDLDFSNYSDEEKAEIEKRLKAFDDNKTAQAQYQRKKEAEERRKAEEERKKAEQKKEEKIKQGIDTFGKVAKAPGELLKAAKKGLNIK